MGAFRGGGEGERRGGGVGRLIEGGGVGRPDGKNLQILDLHRLASLILFGQARPRFRSYHVDLISCR